jgi:hypothetical protein
MPSCQLPTAMRVHKLNSLQVGLDCNYPSPLAGPNSTTPIPPRPRLPHPSTPRTVPSSTPTPTSRQTARASVPLPPRLRFYEAPQILFTAMQYSRSGNLPEKTR